MFVVTLRCPHCKNTDVQFMVIDVFNHTWVHCCGCRHADQFQNFIRCVVEIGSNTFREESVQHEH